MTLEFKGIGGHASVRSDEWLTPPFIIDALGGWRSFELDPCTPAIQPWPTARDRFTRAENGLLRKWWGRVYLNPPYSAVGRWLGRMAHHGQGCALILARTETAAFCDYVWSEAAGLLFLRGRLSFHRPDGSVALRRNGGAADCGAPSVLCAYGLADLEVLASTCLDGKFVPLRFPRALVVAALSQTWRELLVAWLRDQRGPVQLDQVYRAFADHPKTHGNRHWQAKLRQELQAVAERTGRGEWSAA